MIIRADFYIIELPLVNAFLNSQNQLLKRKLGILKLESSTGNMGYGELPLFEYQGYTKETFEIALSELKCELRVLLGETSQLNYTYSTESSGARSCIDMALYHLYSLERSLPLGKILKSRGRAIDAGIVFGLEPIQDIIVKSHEAIKWGYKRIKLKVDDDSYLERVAKFRENFREMPLLIDGNMAFKSHVIQKLKKLEEFSITLIEEPLEKKNFAQYFELKKHLQIPIFADESYENFQELKIVIENRVFDGINLKLCKIGKISDFRVAYQLAQKYGVKTMIGSMLETSLSKSFHAHFGSWGHYCSGDLSDWRRYFSKDILEKNLEVLKGKIELSQRLDVCEEIIRENLVSSFTLE